MQCLTELQATSTAEDERIREILRIGELEEAKERKKEEKGGGGRSACNGEFVLQRQEFPASSQSTANQVSVAFLPNPLKTSRF